jgi:hypothetical protein
MEEELCKNVKRFYKSIMKVLVTTASFGSGLHSNWVDQISDKYEIVFNRIDDNTESPRKKAMLPRLRGKIPRMLVWEDHPGYDYYIWMDAGFSISDSSAIEKMVDKCIDVDACFFKHSARHSVKQEMEFVISLIASGNKYLIDRYEGERMKEQVDEYSKDITWIDNILFECGTFIYSKNIVSNRDYNIMKEWFYHNCIWSVQDQLSLPYLIHKFGIRYKLFEGNVYRNSYTS